MDYNGATGLIEVRLSQVNIRPLDPTLTRQANLVNELGQTDAYIGITSGTGAAGGYHDIVTWQLNNDYQPIDNSVPEPATLGLLGLLCLLGMGLAALGLRERRAA